jgi:hypothetical protein
MTVTEEPLCRWDIPGPGGVDPYQLEARAGGATVVVGRNGPANRPLATGCRSMLMAPPTSTSNESLPTGATGSMRQGRALRQAVSWSALLLARICTSETARPPSRSKRKSAEPVADIRHALLVDARSLCGRTWASRGARTAGSGRALCHRQDRSPAEHPREGKAIVPISAVACVASCPLVNGS